MVQRPMTIPKKVVFYTVRLPLILALMMMGFILEFLVELPFRAIMWCHERFGDRPVRNDKGD
jgi:hypothetical protein